MKKLIAVAASFAVLIASVGAAGQQSIAVEGISADIPTLDQLKVGTDYTDLQATVQFKTHRTDLHKDGTLQKYVADFQKMYPNINIVYESITDYVETMTTRLSTPRWGDLCMIPTTVPLTELPLYFQPLGYTNVLAETYNFADNRMYRNISYGISSTNNVQGIVYNKRIFREAGITAIPKTPDEFLAALQKIKTTTKAIPLYTNFAAGWTMGAWDAYISGTATGDPNFMNQVLPHAVNPFSDRGNGTGPYAVYNVLYEAIRRGLVEDDPSTTDWEGSKGMINRGEIATMVLGSWAIVQMQQGGPNAQDIGYMSFPITVQGKQYASAGPDYSYGINVNSTKEAKIASMLYIKYLVEQSNFDFDQGGIPTVKTHPLPSTLEAFDGISLVADNPTLPGEEDLFTNINVDSEVGLNMTNQHVIDIVEAAIRGNRTLKQITDSWNARWTAAQQKYKAR
ncbi:ABC transporter substrate-binding protein [Pillotina sp. SPG140]|jgi:ABC-type glycerol-3-phosphate transport system substrate-binding protein